MTLTPQRRWSDGPSRLRSHPYWHCFTRAVLSASLRIIVIAAVADRAILALLLSEWLLSYRTSANTMLRASSTLPRFNVVWASGSMAGAAAGLIFTHLAFHGITCPAVWWDPATWSAWPTLEMLRRFLRFIVQ